MGFDRDNLIISILSVSFVVIILTFTFQSLGLSFLLISVIQASIWINFSMPYIRNQGLYFLGYLLVSSIQMGANIDYAIVISSRYLNLRRNKSRDQALVMAVNQGFPTVITSGTIMAVAGLLIGRISTDGSHFRTWILFGIRYHYFHGTCYIRTAPTSILRRYHG